MGDRQARWVERDLSVFCARSCHQFPNNTPVLAIHFPGNGNQVSGLSKTTQLRKLSGKRPECVAEDGQAGRFVR